ncbi:hypothetical protein [Cytophaga aurantiaca]|uniref:hypothetical protein n=1 Tax=Cytophaga aurantiaca TaxID=29530 RepID=UPI00036C6823|nr:hypothetical protein [Cytophaga aurantiaca]
MQIYINQLIEDLTAAQNKKQSLNQSPTHESFEDYIAEVERYLNGEGEEPIGDILGMKEECFPPANRLTEKQLNTVSDAYLECLESWNVSIDLPDNLPAALKYTLLINTLKQKIIAMDSGITHLELCHYDSEWCPFGIKFCRCIETDKDKEFMNSI